MVIYEAGKADGNTSFDDASDNNFTMTTAGNAQWDTAQFPTGMDASMLCDGVGDQISAPDNAVWDFGSGDFTIEFWMRAADVTNIGLMGRYTGGFGPVWDCYIGADNNIGFAFSSDGVTHDIAALGVQDCGAVSINTWYHVACARSGNTWRGFLDGVQGFTFSSAASIFATDQPLRIGVPLNGDNFNGHLASVRITVGVARYTANFTPPSLPLPTS